MSAWVFHFTFAPAVVVGALALAWAVISVPIAAYEVWGDERNARIAAEQALVRTTGQTLRLAVFHLALDIRTWLSDLPDEVGDGDVAMLYQGRFAYDVARIAERLDVAEYPNKPSWLFSDAPKNRQDVAYIAANLDIRGKALPVDFLA